MRSGNVHWQAFRDADEEALVARYRAIGGQPLNPKTTLLRGGGRDLHLSLSDCASTPRRPRLSDCASSSCGMATPSASGQFGGDAEAKSAPRRLRLSDCASVASASVRTCKTARRGAGHSGGAAAELRPRLADCASVVSGSARTCRTSRRGTGYFGGAAAKSAPQGGRTKWECDCGFVVYEHPVIKSHHERRKLHLHKVHGVPWADIPPPPKPSHSASSAATQKAFEGRWQILWINANRWPGAHDISAESIGHPPKHRCKACQRLVKRSDVVSEVCTKHRFRSQVPALKARRKLWGSWSKAARKEATKQRGEARKTQRVADTRKAKVDSSQAFRARSTAGTSIDKPVVQIDLPLVKSSNRNTGNWWKCKYCEFAIPAFSPSRGRSSIKSRHLACGFCTASAMSLSRVAALRPFPPGLPMLRIPTNGDGASLGKLMQLPVGLAPTKSLKPLRCLGSSRPKRGTNGVNPCISAPLAPCWSLETASLSRSALPLRATASLPPALSESASGKPFARRLLNRHVALRSASPRSLLLD